MYYQHYGLSGAPFQFTPSPNVLFMSKAHREAFAALERGLLHEPSGVTLLIGETGTGKTTLIVSILARNYEHVRTAYISNPRLGFDGMLRDLTRQLGIESTASRLDMAEAFDRFLTQLRAGERVVAIVDEAQSLSDEMLEDLRLFANRGVTGEKQLHFVFVGQPGLLQRLMLPGLKQINDRIGTRALLNPLERDEANAYVRYRLSAFDGTIEGVFARGALDYILDHSGGIPRRINVLCHNAMLRGYEVGARKVDLQNAKRTVAEFVDLFSQAKRFGREQSIGDPARTRHLHEETRTIRPAIVLAAFALMGMSALFFWNSNQPRREEPVHTEALDIVGDAVTEHPGATSIAATQNSPKVARTTRTYRRRPASGAAPAPNPYGHDRSASENVSGEETRREIHVRAGDTLRSLALRYLGSEDELGNLIEANPQLKDINHIYVGETLYLPEGAAKRGGQRERRREFETSDLR